MITIFFPKSSTGRPKMTNLMPALVEFFQKPSTSKILMPTDDLMSVVLPENESIDYKKHNPFPKYAKQYL
jgi:hypothetical protein